MDNAWINPCHLRVKLRRLLVYPLRFVLSVVGIRMIIFWKLEISFCSLFRPALVEKALAKLYGSYEALNRKTFTELMVTLTGGYSETIPVRNFLGRPDELFGLLTNAYRRGSLMAGATFEGAFNETSSETFHISRAEHKRQGLLRTWLYWLFRFIPLVKIVALASPCWEWSS